VTHAITLRFRCLLVALTAVLLTIGSLAAAAPAHAHDELVSTDPEADSTVEVLPEELVLTFSGILSTEEGATEIAVTDSAGDSVADGDPEVVETTVTQPLAGDSTGAITVQWKVVSSDGHPISGEFSFDVATPTPTPTPTASSAEPDPTPTETVAPSPTATPEPSSEVSSAVPWVIGGIVALAVIAAVVYLVASRRRTPPTDPGAHATGPDSAGPSER
tara:strand:+ start:406 stop:1059 length:654 start_codon:yes stop_codon:yes gene_type:complete